jgi:hypothetical protein
MVIYHGKLPQYFYNIGPYSYQFFDILSLLSENSSDWTQTLDCGITRQGIILHCAIATGLALPTF